MSNLAKIIKILDPQAGRIQESVLEEKPSADLFQMPAGARGRKMTLLEATTLSDFPVLLRDGVRTIAFDRYTATPTTWNQIADFVSSDKMQETWVEENVLGELPIVGEANPYPLVDRDLDRAFDIRNHKRGFIYEVTEEVIRFNRLNILKRDAAMFGRSAANTREQAVYSVLTTAGNYTRNSSTGDNDIGANTAATTFSATGLNTALTTLRTMKDRKSGAYQNVNPDTLIVAPRLEMAAKQLLLSPMLQRVGGSTTNDVYGGGTTNPFKGVVNTIIVAPRLGTSYQWVLMEAKMAIVLQEVEPFGIFDQSSQKQVTESWFQYDVVQIKVRDWFGVGMVNDRFAYYSSSTSAPTVD